MSDMEMYRQLTRYLQSVRLRYALHYEVMGLAFDEVVAALRPSRRQRLLQVEMPGAAKRHVLV